MKKIIMMIFIILLSFFFHRMIIIYKVFAVTFNKNNNFDTLYGEDKYHKIRKNKNMIYNTYIFSDNNENISPFFSELSKKIIFFTRNSLPKITSELLDNDIIKFVPLSESIHNIKDNPKVLTCYFSFHEKSFKLVFNHCFIGGPFFINFGNYLFDSIPPQLYKLPLILDIISLLKFAVKDRVIDSITQDENINKLSMYNDEKHIERYIFTFNLKDINVSKRIYIIYHIIDILRNCIAVKKELKIIIPVAFGDLTCVHNNIGVLFLTVPIDGFKNYEELQTKITEIGYHIHATNLWLNIFTDVEESKKVRNDADIILSMLYITSNEIIMKHQLETSYTTYYNIPDYPIYCNCITFSDKTFVTLTVSTPNFDYSKIKKYNNVAFNLKKINL